MARQNQKTLKGMSDIRRYFHRHETPIFFISATNFNLLGLDEWVRNFKYINYIDCYDGRHPNTFVPGEAPHPEFQSIEDIQRSVLRLPSGELVFLGDIARVERGYVDPPEGMSRATGQPALVNRQATPVARSPPPRIRQRGRSMVIAGGGWPPPGPGC